MATRQSRCTVDPQASLNRRPVRRRVDAGRSGPPAPSRATTLAFVLAGGRGERLHPLTARRCKPAVCFGGSLRVIDFTLFNCVASGLTSVHVLTQYRGESLRSYLNGRWRAAAGASGMRLEVVPSRPSRLSGTPVRTPGPYLGTADAVHKNRHLLDTPRPEHVLVLSGDHVYHADYRRLIASHIERGADATLLVDEVPAVEASSFGVVRARPGGRVEEFVEKPADPAPYSRRGACLINLGVYVFSTGFLLEALHHDATSESSRDFGRDVLPYAAARSRVFACSLRAITPGGAPYWRDVGTIDSLFQAHMDLLGSPAAFRLDDWRWPPSSTFRSWLPRENVALVADRCDGSPARSLISSTARISGASLRRSVVGSAAVVGPGASLEECIVFPGARIAPGARLRRVIVDEGARVDAPVEVGLGEAPHPGATALGVTVLTA